MRISHIEQCDQATHSYKILAVHCFTECDILYNTNTVLSISIKECYMPTNSILKLSSCSLIRKQESSYWDRNSSITSAKKFIKVHEVRELPSFLLNLTDIPEDVRFPPKPTVSDHYLGPVFFGKCNENHPPLHSIDFSTFRQVQKTYYVRENINHLFLPKCEGQKPIKVLKSPKFQSVRRKETYSDPYTHRCPGGRKAFVPELKSPVTDLGESTSIIEGETVLEIPLYRLKKDSSGCRMKQIMDPVPEFELVNFSDIKEKKRKFMPYNERISHIHFPKQFATVTVVGPTIPAAINVTKLPTKRKMQPVEDLLNISKVRKSSKERINEEEVKEELGVDFSVEEGDSIFSAEESMEQERNLEIQIIDEKEEEGDVGEFSSDRIEEAPREDEEPVESDGEQPVEEIQAEGTEIIENTEENEEQLQGNPDEGGEETED